MRKILRPKFWSLGTNLGSPWARLAKGLPQIFCHDGFYIVLRVPYNPHRVPFMVDFLFTNIHSGHRCFGHQVALPNLCHFLTEMVETCSPGTFFLQMFGHAKFQLSVFHKKLLSSVSAGDEELKFCMSKHLQKMCLETKFLPFLVIHNRDIG